jgi:hypothetical protein
MQFSTPYNELYQDVIRPICDELKLNVLRADETYGPGLIIADITKEIAESRIVIAEVSPLNTNVFYEVGYAHALNKPTILIAENPLNCRLMFRLFGHYFMKIQLREKRFWKKDLENMLRLFYPIKIY